MSDHYLEQPSLRSCMRIPHRAFQYSTSRFALWINTDRSHIPSHQFVARNVRRDQLLPQNVETNLSKWRNGGTASVKLIGESMKEWADGRCFNVDEMGFGGVTPRLDLSLVDRSRRRQVGV